MTLVEPYAGLGAVGYSLIGAPQVISRTGSKFGYADCILWIAGLHSGMGCDRIIFRDLDKCIVEFHRAITSPATCRQVASLLRSWIPINDRELYDRIRLSEAPSDLIEFVTSYVYLQSRSYSGKQVSVECNRWKVHGFRPEFDPRRGAGWTNPRHAIARTLESVAVNVRWPCVEVAEGDAMSVEAIPGAVYYLDPPYAGTTGYQHASSTADVIALAHRLDATGCIVIISEAIDLLKMLGSGWYKVDVTNCRKGESRLFGHTREFVFINRKSVWKPTEQPLLFG